MTEIDLRPWQAEAIHKAEKWLLESRISKHFLINASPGAGKTICASVIAKNLIETNEIDRVVVIAPRAEVVRQWAEEYGFVTGRHMTRVTGADGEVDDFGVDLCATWSATQGLLDAFQQVCKESRTLVICDEHHHAAVEAAWGTGADGAFTDATFILILTGTPIRSDGKEPIWFAYDDMGRINHPEEGTYTLTYGKAVDLGYCRPITFHRHEGRFSVALPDGDKISVSGRKQAELDPPLKRIQGLKQALDFYKLACTPKYLEDEQTPDVNSYQGSMLEWAISKLSDLRLSVPNAGGLVIAPNIEVAEYMAELLEIMEGEKPVLVHSQLSNAEGRISTFKKTEKKWIVSVAMVSEGVDIKRLRVLVYLPFAQTELAFRQAMGRVVRTLGDSDFSRAYVVMPTHRVFEEWARRVEDEMSPAAKLEAKPNHKICPICEAQCEIAATACSQCDHEFPATPPRLKKCQSCDALNPVGLQACQNCGASFLHDFEITLNEALRMGAIVRGMDIDEDEVRDGEENADEIRAQILASGDDALINIVKLLPEESYGRLRKILDRRLDK